MAALAAYRASHEFLEALRAAHGARTHAPWPVALLRAWPEQSQRRRARRGRHVHQPGIVADEEPRPLQARRDVEEVGAGRHVDQPPGRDRGEQRRDLLALRRRRGHQHARARKAPAGRGQPADELDEAPDRPGLRAPVRRRADREHRRVAGEQRGGARAMRGREPDPRRGQFVDARQRRQFAHPMDPREGLAVDDRAAAQEEAGGDGAAQVDRHVPARAEDVRPEREPVAGEAALRHHDDALEAGDRGEERSRRRAAGDGHARAGVALQQVRQQRRRQHRVADARRRDEQEVQAGTRGPGALTPRVPRTRRRRPAMSGRCARRGRPRSCGRRRRGR